MTQYYGKYRGTVEGNIDPDGMGRLMVSVPAVTGSGTLNWAMPSVPFAAKGIGLLPIPPIGANVWVEYEGGDPDHPIWSGCFWGKQEAPKTIPPGLVVVTLKTQNCTLTLSDAPGVGGVSIETSTGMKITMGAMGVQIDDGKGGTIQLQGKSVLINNGALEVT